MVGGMKGLPIEVFDLLNYLQSLTALVVITVVKGLDIKQYRESIVFPRLGALLDGSKPVVPVSVGARGNGAGSRER